MDQILRTIVKHEKEPRKLASILNGRQAREIVAQNARQIPEVLAALDVRVHCVGYCWLLDWLGGVRSARIPDVDFLKLSMPLLVNFTRDIREVGDDFASVARCATACAVRAGLAGRILRVMKDAADALAPTVHTLTPLHACFMNLALVQRQYTMAREVADRTFMQVSSSKTGMKARDFLSFTYYCGLTFTALRQWRNALDAFKECISCPGTAVSAIAVAAYKKFVLVSLIYTGEVGSLGKGTPSVVERVVRKESQHYRKIAEGFASSAPDLDKAIAEAWGWLVEDGNHCLVQRVVAARQRHAILRLTQAFVSMSLQDIAERAGLASAAEAEQQLLRMVEDGELSARIDQGAGMVTFQSEDETFDDPETLAKIDQYVMAANDLARRLREAEIDVGVSTAAVAREMREQSRAGGAAGGAEGDMGDVGMMG